MSTLTPNLKLKQPALSDKVVDTIGTDLPEALGILDNSPHVGEIKFFGQDVNPNTIWPGTTWTQLHDVFLVAVGSKFAAGSSGGQSEHYHVIPIGFDKNAIYYHHESTDCPAYGSQTLRENVFTAPVEWSGYGDIREAFTSKESNLPPYRAVYIWERTA